MRRIGKLTFSTHLIDNDKDEIAEALSQIKFLPFRVEHLLETRELEMVGYSYKFDEIKVGVVPPTYILEMMRNDGGEIFVTDVLRAPSKLRAV